MSSSVLNSLRYGVCVLIAVLGVVVFYVLAAQGYSLVWQVLALLALLVLAVVGFLFTPAGRGFRAFTKEAIHEVRRMVWPTRKETVQMTGIVFLLVFVMALYLWLIDKTIEWSLYDLLLGWRR